MYRIAGFDRKTLSEKEKENDHALLDTSLSGDCPDCRLSWLQRGVCCGGGHCEDSLLRVLGAADSQPVVKRLSRAATRGVGRNQQALGRRSAAVLAWRLGSLHHPFKVRRLYRPKVIRLRTPYCCDSLVDLQPAWLQNRVRHAPRPPTCWGKRDADSQARRDASRPSPKRQPGKTQLLCRSIDCTSCREPA